MKIVVNFCKKVRLIFYYKVGNVLVIEFNKYGVVINKKLLTKNDMKEIVYSTNKTENPVTEQSFVTRFLQSVKQKMYGKRKF